MDSFPDEKDNVRENSFRLAVTEYIRGPSLRYQSAILFLLPHLTCEYINYLSKPAKKNFSDIFINAIRTPYRFPYKINIYIPDTLKGTHLCFYSTHNLRTCGTSHTSKCHRNCC